MNKEEWMKTMLNNTPLPPTSEIDLLYRVVGLLEDIKATQIAGFYAVTTDTWFKYPPAPEVKHE